MSYGMSYHRYKPGTTYCSGGVRPLHYFCDACGGCIIKGCSGYTVSHDATAVPAVTPVTTVIEATTWREIPAHRVLRVPVADLKQFAFYDANEKPTTVMAGVRAMRLRDNYWFRKPRYLEYIVDGGKAVQLEPEHG